MGYMKYALSKTGWFPKYEPKPADVSEASGKISKILPIEKGYYYIFPEKHVSDKRVKLEDLIALFDVFASNGIILRPHWSKYFNCFVLRFPNNGQKFIQRVKKLNDSGVNSTTVYQNITEEYAEEQQKSALNLQNKTRSK